MFWFLGIGLFFTVSSIALMFDDFVTGLMGIVIGIGLIGIGLLLIWKKKPQVVQLLKDRKVVEAAKALFSKSAVSSGNDDSGFSVDTFQLAGVNYYHSNIKKLANLNPQWKLTAAQHLANGKAGKRIYKNHFTNAPVKLIPEPHNPHDRNAVAVYIADQLVGYIRRDQTLQVKSLLKSSRIKYISGFIGGGEYKYISSDGSTSLGDDPISVNIRIGHT